MTASRLTAARSTSAATIRPLVLATATALITMASGFDVAIPRAAAKVQTRNAEDMLVVDCLLPGQIRKLGAMSTFMSARRPIRTTQADCEIRGGEYVSSDRANYQTALKVWMDQAMSGSAEAQNYVGEIYLKGLGVAPDYQMAALWLQRAADQGFKRAKNNLGYLFEMGLGVPRDTAKALNLYREASGISGDELLFASTVKVEMQAKEAQIETLQQTVSEQQQETEALKSKVKDLESQLASRRNALQSAQSELQSTRSKLAAARKAAGADDGALNAQREALAVREREAAALTASLEAEKAAVTRRKGQIAQQEAAIKSQTDKADATSVAELKAQSAQLAVALQAAQERADLMQAQLLTNQSVLGQEQQKYAAEIARLEKAAEGRNQEDWALMKLLETQLSQREGEVREQQVQIAALEQQSAAGGLLAAIPTLEVIDPPLTVTRGKPAAMLQGSPQRQSVVGRVSVPASVAQITVNGVPVILGDNGLFRASVPVASAGSNVQITAIDKQGGQATLDFLLMPQAGAPAPSTAAALTSSSSSGGRLPADVKLGRFYALVVGNNSYASNSFQPLKSAVNDATAVSEILKNRYGFESKLLLNATRFDILASLNDLRERLKPEDNLLVYYAGHGDLGSDGRVGYWVPVDGQPAMPNTWIPNTAISEILDTMQAAHVMIVADSCYSGALTGASRPAGGNAGSGAAAWDDWVKTMNAGRSRTALTAGGLEPVPDSGSGRHSYFARALLNVLTDNNRLLDGQSLFREITTVLALTAIDAPVTQVPEYAPLQFAGHESGEFFFMPTDAGVAGSR